MLNQELALLIDAMRMPAEGLESAYFHKFRKEATNTLREKGWLYDGSLAGQDLRHTHWGGTQLIGANFRHCNLDEADFSICQLENASFYGASLRGAMFNFATLLRCDFTAADLSTANMTNADVELATFSQTHLQGTTFFNTIFGNTLLSHLDLGSALQLHRAQHRTPSLLIINGTPQSRPIPKEFLQGIGWDDDRIRDYYRGET